MYLSKSALKSSPNCLNLFSEYLDTTDILSTSPSWRHLCWNLWLAPLWGFILYPCWTSGNLAFPLSSSGVFSLPLSFAGSLFCHIQCLSFSWIIPSFGKRLSSRSFLRQRVMHCLETLHVWHAIVLLRHWIDCLARNWLSWELWRHWGITF